MEGEAFFFFFFVVLMFLFNLSLKEALAIKRFVRKEMHLQVGIFPTSHVA